MSGPESGPEPVPLAHGTGPGASAWGTGPVESAALRRAVPEPWGQNPGTRAFFRLQPNLQWRGGAIYGVLRRTGDVAEWLKAALC